MSEPEFDLCVIGGGAAGLVVAAGGAKLGAKIALVEKQRLGGDCLWSGCIPSKALLHAARVAHMLRRAQDFGLTVSAPDIQLAQVMQRVAAVIKSIESHDSPERFRALGVDVVFGAGRFVDPRTFRVSDRTLTARNFVIATGSRPALPHLAGLEKMAYLTNETIFEQKEQIPHLIVLGGGPIGVEMAQAFVRLGSRVSLLQRGTQILPREDEDLAALVAAQLRQDGIEIFLGHEAVSINGTAGNLQLQVKNRQGELIKLHGSKLLCATGRRANIEELGLESAGVAVKNGFIVTDRRLRTTARNIYACGDVAGPYLFTHMAEHQAGVVLRNALFHLPAKMAQDHIPWCTYSDPELARVGLSEREAKERGISHKVYTFPYSNIDRARTDGFTNGLAKIVTTEQGRLLGAAIAGAHAGELIHEYILAIAKGMKAKDLSNTIHIYPTLAQINRRVADQRLAESLTPRSKRWIKRIFRLRGA